MAIIHVGLAMATDSGSSYTSSSNQGSSEESPLELSYESSSFESEGESVPGVHPFMYEPLTASSGTPK